jgi:hypothetical protein
VLREKCGQQTKKFENFQTPRSSSGVAGLLTFFNSSEEREASAFIIILLKRAR